MRDRAPTAFKSSCTSIRLYSRSNKPRQDEPHRCELEDGPALALDTARRLACDSTVVGIVEGEDGEPLDIGRKTRSIPAAISRALKARDGGCRFPGCDRTRFCDGHHIMHWANGGETKLENLITLCGFHHRLVHEGGYGLRRTDDGLFIFTRPDGRRVEAEWRAMFPRKHFAAPSERRRIRGQLARLPNEARARACRSRRRRAAANGAAKRWTTVRPSRRCRFSSAKRQPYPLTRRSCS